MRILGRYIRPRKPAPTVEETLAKIKYVEEPCPIDGLGNCHSCLNWCNPKGYAVFHVRGKTRYVHRLVYENRVGPIHPSMVIDHICRNKKCCNVDHLRAVTPKENALENSESMSAKNKVKTHCKRGHPLSGDNLKILKKGRACRECANMLKKKYDRESRGKIVYLPH